MKSICYILLLFQLYTTLFAQQYYLRGEVKDEAGNILQNVRILQHKTGFIFRSGSLGTFGILCHQPVDTFSFSIEGYRTETLVLHADKYASVKLKPLTADVSNIHRHKLSSLIINLDKQEQKKWYTGEETYISLLENQFVCARKYPHTSISLNIDRASYSNIRRFIKLNSRVPPYAVRIEEMINYFNLNYEEPKGNDVFRVTTLLSSCPWNKANQLFYIKLCSRKLNPDLLPPSNLVFLIDVSGSMDMPNRLPLLKSAMKLLVNNLRDKDSVAIVVYGGVTGIMLNTTSGNEKEKIIKVIDELEPGGFTPGESGIILAYKLAKKHFIEGGNNRVILATDGDFNVGIRTEEELDELISSQKERGIYLTCLGVGMGNYKDSRIQTLAKKGNGNFAYLDNFKEAEKVLLKEFTQTLYSVADDVYMNVEFNPEFVKEYRLIGFDNKVGALRDSLSIIEGGEIGSGFSLIAMFEIIPADSHKNEAGHSNAGSTFADITLQYKIPGEEKQYQHNFSAHPSFKEFATLDKSYRFCTAVAMFGSLLRQSPFMKKIGWSDIIKIASEATTDENFLQKEFIELVEKAKNLYSKTRKKKGLNIY